MDTEKTIQEEIKYIETKPGQLENSGELAKKISEILDDKKAVNVKIIETNKQTIVADYFVVATGTSSTHIKTLAGEIELQLKEKSGLAPSRVNGRESNDWIILDYDCVLAHIFNSEARDYYKLERLWGDAADIDVEGLLKLDKNL